jgi:hypothetical protein
MAHQLQRLIHLAVGDRVEKGRLPKLYREPLPQGVVEDRVARGVGEVGEDDGVFVGKFGPVARTPVEPASHSNDRE